MAVRLFARGSDGVVAITEGGVNATTHANYLSEPYKNIDNIYFHSSFDYMSLAAVFNVSITLGQKTKRTETDSSKKDDVTYDVPTRGRQRHILGTHGLGYVPFATVTRGANQVTPSLLLQSVGASQRLCNISMDSSKIYLAEDYLTYKSTLPEITENFTVWVYRNPA